MRRLLFFCSLPCQQIFKFAFRVFLCLFLLSSEIYCSANDRQSRPNECSDDKASPCCPGWQIAPTSGLCLIAVCDKGCGNGQCIGANLCRCQDGTLSSYCGEETNSKDSLPPESKYDQSVQRERFRVLGGCEGMGCEHSCHLTVGVPRCHCASGYTLNQDGKSCDDVDECKTFSDMCSQGCRNTVGGFICVCHAGFILHSDGKNCVPEVEQTRTTTTVRPSTYAPAEKQRVGGRRYIDDMLDPNSKPPSLIKPKMAIEARVRTVKSKRKYTQGGLSTTDYHSVRSPRYPAPTPVSKSTHRSRKFDPYSLPAHFNPRSRYEQLPPELTKQIFHKYDKKKLVPFDFDERDYESTFDPDSISSAHDKPRAIFWEEIPTAPGATEDRPSSSHQSQKTPHTSTSTTQPSINPQLDAQKQIIKARIKTRKSRKQIHRKRKKQNQRRFRKKLITSTSATTHDSQNLTTPMATTSEGLNNTELLQKDGRYCRGDLCYYPGEEIDTVITTARPVKVDDFGQCPSGYEKVIVNDFEVCKPLPGGKVETARPTLSINSIESLSNVHSEAGAEVRSGIAIARESNVERNVVNPIAATLPPFINYCVKEGKIMIITAQGIHCKNKTEEHIYVNCEEQEVYIETVAGYICRDPSTEDVLSTPIQCPQNHALIKTNTGYECRGTVTIESSCPDGYKTVSTMSGTICSPAAPLSPPETEICDDEEFLLETDNGIECKTQTQQLVAPTTFVTNASQPLENSTDVAKTELKCPPGQIAVKSVNGSQCKFYSRLQQGRGDLPPTCPTGQTFMDTKSGPICIGDLVSMEHGGFGSDFIETWTQPIPSSPCSNGQELVKTEFGEECQDIETLSLPTNNILFIQNSCPAGQVEWKTEHGFECRWLGLERLGNPMFLCASCCSLQQTNFGLLCVNKTTQTPAIDMDTSCSDDQVAVVTPRGSICMFSSLIKGKILTVTELSQLSSSQGCRSYVEFPTTTGGFCLDKTTREPIIDDAMLCPNIEVSVLTPKGFSCEPMEAVSIYTLSYTCYSEHSVAKTKEGFVCVDRETGQPAVDNSFTCAEGLSAIQTPTGTICHLKNLVVSLLGEKFEIDDCGTGQSILETAAGTICIDAETLLPVIDESIICPDGQASVLTPTGSFCKLRSDILTRTSKKPGPKAKVSTNGSILNLCGAGQKILETAAGSICIDSDTLLPILNKTALCPSDEDAVITPIGTLCKSRSAILTRVTKHPSQEGSEEEGDFQSCGVGQKILETAAGSICIHAETLLPMIDETVSCSDGHAPVVTPRGTFCRFRSDLLTAVPDDPETRPSCESTQKVIETAAGPICFYKDTMLPVVNKSGSCPDDQVSVITPRGTFCRLRSALLTIFSIKPEESITESMPLCNEGQKMLQTSDRPICVHSNNSLPVTNETMSCEGNQIAVVTPDGSFCQTNTAIFTAMAENIDPTLPTPSCDNLRVFETFAGMICFHSRILLPKLDGNLTCPDDQVPAVTPLGSMCKLRYDTLTFLTDSPIPVDMGTPTRTCNVNQEIQELNVGEICIDTDTRSPVVDDSMTCEEDHIAVFTPSGSKCFLSSEIFVNSAKLSRMPSPGRPICYDDNIAFSTQLGDICIYEGTYLPVINITVQCSAGSIPVVTPSGTFCRDQSEIFFILSLESSIKPCSKDEWPLQTNAGVVCVYKSNSQPVIDKSKPCDFGEVYVKTPSGSKCILRTVLLGKFFLLFGEYARTSSLNITLPLCAKGQISEKTEFGDICLDSLSLEPIIDKTVTCSSGQVGVFTPSGVKCKPQSIIFTRISKPKKSLVDVNIEKTPKTCGLGYSVQETDGGQICVDERTKDPVVDKTIYCPEGQMAIKSPTGTFCMLYSAVAGQSLKIPTSATITSTQESLLAQCQAGQTAFKTNIGDICIYESTQDLVIDKDVPCPEEQVAVVSPSGTFCMLKSAVYSKLKQVFPVNGNKSAPATCLTLDTEFGRICVDKETQQPMLDKSVQCDGDKAPVLTPSGTLCVVKSVVLAQITKPPFEPVTPTPSFEDFEPEDHLPCGANQTVFVADIGSFCIYTETSEPVINQNECPEGLVSVLTLSGNQCMLKSALIAKIMSVRSQLNDTTTGTSPTNELLKITVATPLPLNCGADRIALDTEFGLICFERKTLQPVIDTFIYCEDDKQAVITPTGYICIVNDPKLFEKLVTAKQGNAEIDLTTPKISDGDLDVMTTDTLLALLCGTNQRPLDTEFGPICFDKISLQPVIDRSIFCEDNKQAAITPTGHICIVNNPKLFEKVRSANQGKSEIDLTTSKIFDHDSDVLTTETLLALRCETNQILLDTEFGPICFDKISLQPVIDTSIYCEDNKQAVITPTGHICIVNNPKLFEKLVTAKQGNAEIDLTTPKISDGDLDVVTTDTLLALLCGTNQRPLDTEFGPICFDKISLQPVIDTSIYCEDGKQAAITPTGYICIVNDLKLFEKFLTAKQGNAEIDLTTPKISDGDLDVVTTDTLLALSCGTNQRPLDTEFGPICFDKISLQPVIDTSIYCEDDKQAVITPTGYICIVNNPKLFEKFATAKQGNTEIDLTTPKISDGDLDVVTTQIPLALNCGADRTMLDTEFGSICLNKKTLQPIIDTSIYCEDDKQAVITPTGHICIVNNPKLFEKFLTAKQGNVEIDLTTPKISDGDLDVKTTEIPLPLNCGADRTMLDTEFGTICFDKISLQPMIDTSIYCEDDKQAVITPTGYICIVNNPKLFEKLVIAKQGKSEIDLTTPKISDGDLDVKTTEIPLPLNCSEGRAMLDTEFGTICFDKISLQPMIDRSIYCKDDKQAVITPTGHTCIVKNSTLFDKVSTNLKSTPEKSRCGEGFMVYKLKSSEICLYIDTRQPVIREELDCPGKKIGVLTPKGTKCKSKKVILNGKFFDEEPSSTTNLLSSTIAPTIGSINENLIETGCNPGQILYQTNAGVICVYDKTLDPVIDNTVFCPDNKIAVFTPSGTSCRLRDKLIVSKDKMKVNIRPLTPKTICPPGQLNVLTSTGYVCTEIKNEIESHLISSSVGGQDCGIGQVKSKVSSFDICLYKDSLKPVINLDFTCPFKKVAVKTPIGTECLVYDDLVVIMGLPSTLYPEVQPTPIKPVCKQGQIPVIRNGQFVCRHIVVDKETIEENYPPTKQIDICAFGQIVYSTSAGQICVTEETLQPVLNTSVSCPEGQIAVLTPLGLACLNDILVFEHLPERVTAETTATTLIPTKYIQIEATEIPATKSIQTKATLQGGVPSEANETYSEKSITEDTRVNVIDETQTIQPEIEETETRGSEIEQPGIEQPEIEEPEIEESEEDIDEIDMYDSEDCPPGYDKKLMEGMEEPTCQYVGFGKLPKTKNKVETKQKTLKCPFGMVLIQTSEGVACRFPFKSPATQPPIVTNAPSSTRPIIPTAVPCQPGIDCDGDPSFNSRNSVPTKPCVGNCQNPMPAPCLGASGCGLPGPCMPGVNCIGSGLPIHTGCSGGMQPCMPPGGINWPGNMPCGGGCGNIVPPISPCQTGACGHPTHGIPPFNGCSSAGSPCSGYPNFPYRYTIQHSCSSGYQPYQQGKVYMCIPANFKGLCQDAMLLKTLLGRTRCSGISQAVPPIQKITPCSPNGRNPVTGRLTSGCSPVTGLQALEDSSGICREGERLFRTPKGSTVCLQSASVSSSSLPQVQQEAIPSCRAGEQLIQTERGYSCQRSSTTECNPPCANGGQCREGRCRCPRGLTGNACQTDIDECKRLPSRYCHYKCENGFGNYQCVCPQGYQLNSDKRTCKAIGCTPECENGGRCMGGECRCTRGFSGEYCQTDVDECSEREGLCEYRCLNTPGNYTCICPPGFTLNEDGRTCKSKESVCMPSCQNGASCKNNRCFCAPGFHGVSCQLDINECYHFRPCSHMCHNTKGSYICMCRHGYRLSSDGHMCLRSSPPDDRARSRQRRKLVSRRRKSS